VSSERGEQSDGRKKILIAEDEDDMRALIRATLGGDARYRVLEARDGEEVLRLVRLERPTLVFLDIVMPLVDGLEVCRRIKGDPATRSTSVVMLTALGQPADMERGRQVGADDYMTKPFSPTALLRKVEEIMER
jgi:two-component system phosphate regulon response regulator PhoB